MIKLICTRSKRVKTSKNVLGFPLKDILLFFWFFACFQSIASEIQDDFWNY